MSIADRIRGLVSRPNDDLAKDEVSLTVKYATRALGGFAGGCAMVLGITAASGLIFSFSVACLVAGIWQMLAGFLVLVGEAPCCCIFIDFVSQMSDRFDKLQYWHRGVFYVGISIPPLFMCFGVSTLFGSGLIFATGVAYGLMSLGKKASITEMQSRASGNPDVSNTDGTKSGLVDNAQGMSHTPHISVV